MGLGEARGGSSHRLTVDPQTKAVCLDGRREEGGREEGLRGQAPSPAYLGQKDWPAPPQTPPLPRLPTLWLLCPCSPLPPQNRSPHLGLFMGGKSTNHSTLGSCPGCAEMLRVASSLSRTQESWRNVQSRGGQKNSQTAHMPRVRFPTIRPLAHSALAPLGSVLFPGTLPGLLLAQSGRAAPAFLPGSLPGFIQIFAYPSPPLTRLSKIAPLSLGTR